MHDEQSKTFGMHNDPCLTSTLDIFSKVSWSTVVSVEVPSLMIRSVSLPPECVIPHPSYKD